MMSGERPHRRSQLSDVVSTIPSTSAGTSGVKKRRLAPVTEEPEPPAEEPEPAPIPAVSPAPSASVFVPRINLVDIVKYGEELHQSPACNVVPDTEEKQQTNNYEPAPDPADLFQDDINNECLQMICDRVDEITRSQADRIQKVFKYCYNYSPPKSVVPDDQILCESSDLDL